ncbi:AraC family transcriptional regulator [Paenibacillus sp. H1-7]|uniref:helix-turn-helix domain-containing protein n=1 Tax=Paenibacillus sp. H1-7 TaxID=2282849 RepID=UPI001EF81F5E|nr:helix-turn-helix domain-containing protein [Paenibacillus sp. H1-7]ULL14924.1 AraC family transcriptional regulator [Paenibacillus sp. H1-7]
MKTVTFRRWLDNLYLFSHKETYTASVEHFHAHDGLEILYIHEGDGKYIINDRIHQVRPHTLIVIKPFQMHYIHMNVPPDYTRTVFKVKASLIEQYASIFPVLSSFLSQIVENKMSRQLFYLNDEQAAHLEYGFKDLHESLSSGLEIMNRESVILFFYHFFSYFQRMIYTEEVLTSDPISLGSTQAQHINNILKWINHHYKSPFKIEDIAQELHFSPNYLSALFKEQLGKTITEYTMDKRLEEAKSMLYKQDVSIRQISAETGFRSPSYFISMFKKKYGVTPHQYAASIKKLISQLTNE